ncbi:ParB/RepB/Spo0J family partition protein [Enterovibrio paralichthyis]|uniref:ParB/RepB/Spo0J family partition protein n=1 Tax=Enterovibrio paralichthyis TaxID=2853805 RepID=UPI001C47ED42|nr:ParB/RepB/Spo0J family partition protein [Enterovibrio paralichthyis]MBV7300212.1 ParB/RepB/Spo0J family partition protein [Enterovibrio paralichthyis]
MNQVTILAIANIKRDPKQPRKVFDASALSDLAASIKECGVLQPILVREDPKKSGHYYIVAGERRYRASKKAGLKEVPCLVRADSVAQVRSIQLHENFNRENLSLAEIIEGVREYKAAWLAENPKGKLTNKALAAAVGQNTTFISRLLKLDSAPDLVLYGIREGIINNINVASNLTDLYAVNPDTFENVWYDYREGNVSGSFEKYTAIQLKMAKTLAEGGFISPEPDSNGCFALDNDAVHCIKYASGQFSFAVHTLQVDEAAWIVAPVFAFNNAECVEGKLHTNNERFDSELMAQQSALQGEIIKYFQTCTLNGEYSIGDRQHIEAVFAELNRLTHNQAGEPEFPSVDTVKSDKLSATDTPECTDDHDEITDTDTENMQQSHPNNVVALDNSHTERRTSLAVNTDLVIAIGTLEEVFDSLVNNHSMSKDEASALLTKQLYALEQSIACESQKTVH